MQILFKSVLAFAVIAAALIDVTPTRAAEYAGVPAMRGVGTLRAQMDVSGSGLTRQITIAEFAADPTKPIRAYGIDMTKRIHLIIVSDDLQVFMHVHPILGSDGRFRITNTFPRPALYHLYADAVPADHGHAVFRFDVGIDAPAPSAAIRQIGPSLDTASAGPYTVKMSDVSVQAGVDTPVLIEISKAGEPASDLHPYLGAFAHIVAIGVADLSYTHIHAMDTHAMAMGDDMTASMPSDAIVPATMDVHLNLARRGTYKVWIQFQGGTRVYAAPFVVTAH
jgi:hypothetical protein